MAVAITVGINGKTLDEFGREFVIHPTAPETHSVTITTTPAAATVAWKLTPEKEYSGKSVPAEGADKVFAFTPKDAKRPHAGLRVPNRPIRFVLTITPTDSGVELAPQQFFIEQGVRAILRQEYLDFGLRPPDLSQIAVFEDGETEHFKARDFIGNCNYAKDRIGVKAGMQQIAEETRAAYGRGMSINSAYRNPQRNAAVGGKKKSVHQSGGAVDMSPLSSEFTVQNKLALYRAALASATAKLVLLEKGPSQLLPGRWNPPNATHDFTHQGATISVGDLDGDGLPDTVTAIVGAPAKGIPNNIHLEYVGGGKVDPPFCIGNQSAPRKMIAVGDPLFLLHAPENKKLWGKRESAPLKDFFQIASHVHGDTRQLPLLLTDPVDLKKDEFDPFGTTGVPQHISFELLKRWGSTANVMRLMGFPMVASEAELYTSVEQFAKERLDELATLYKDQGIFLRKDWAEHDWPRIELPDVAFDWDYNAVVIHHSGNKPRRDPREIEHLQLDGDKNRDVVDIKYHFLVDSEGHVFEGRSLLFKGGHVAGANTGKIGILMIGDFEPNAYDLQADQIQEAQIVAAIKLIKRLKTKFPLTVLGGHVDFMSFGAVITGSLLKGFCPGTNMYLKLDRFRTETGLTHPT